MPSFKSPNISVATVKGDTPPGAKRRSAMKRDMVLLVEDYNLETHTLTGTTPRGQRTEVHVHPDAVAWGEKSRKYLTENNKEMPPFFGHSIDASMKARIPADGKHYVILDRAETQRTIPKKASDPNSVDLALVVCQRIVNGGVNPKKVFEGLFTVTQNSKFQQVDRVQSWSPEAVLAEDTAAIQVLADSFDRVSSSYHTAQAQVADGKGASYLPTVGVELRVIQNDANPAVKARIVDLSGRIERTRAVFDDSTRQVITPSVPFTGDLLKQTVEQYIAYARAAYGEDARVEVASYTSYPAGRFNEDFDFKNVKSGYSPLLQMASARTKQSADEAAFVEGGNYGGWGVALITPDKNDDQGVLKEQNFVNQLFANSNRKWFVHGKIQSVDGQVYDISDGLKGEVLQYKPANAATKPANTAPRFQTPAAAPSAPSHSIAQAPAFESSAPPTAISNPLPTQTAKPSHSNHQDPWDTEDDIPFEGSEVESNPRSPKP
jgi:hypothetical protein